MTLKALQNEIAERLNADAALKAGGCVAIAEDSLDVVNAIVRQLSQVGGVALIVSTPSITRNGFVEVGIPFDADAVNVQAQEIVTVNRVRPGAVTALEAAQRVALLLDSETFEFRSLRQAADERTGVLTATAEFAYSGVLS